MVARLGQQRELVTKAFSKVVPFSISARRWGICSSVLGFKSSALRSSVRIRTTLGGLSLSSFGVSPAEGKQAESAKQATSSEMEGKPLRAILRRRLVAAAASDRGISTLVVYSVRDPQVQR